MAHKTLLIAMITLVPGVALANASQAASIEISRKFNLNVTPKPEGTAGKKIFAVFDGSPRMTSVLQEKLMSKGFVVAKRAEDADVTYKWSGVFSITGAGKAPSKGPLGELLETSVKQEVPATPDYQHQNINIVQITAATAGTGLISVTDMVRWIGQKTGVAGRFNEMLTGDPRGSCWHENCGKFTSFAVVSVRGSDGTHWWLQGTALSEKVVLDIVIEDALEHSLKPLNVLKGGAQ